MQLTMEFQEEVVQQGLKKQALQKLIAVGTQYVTHWTECLETSQKIDLIGTKQLQRAEEQSLSDNGLRKRAVGPYGNQIVDFEERQRVEKRAFESQNDERSRMH
jgi:hypothetical protein